MDFYIIGFIKILLLPPGNIFLLLLITLFLFKYSAHLARRLLLVSCLLFYFMSIPIVAISSIDLLENYPPLTLEDIDQHEAQAIVILGGGRGENPEYGGNDVSDVSLNTLERLRYGAFLQSKTHLPILVTGGFINPEDTPEGQLMAKSLERDFKTQTQWQENRSRNTAENAIYTREILAAENIHTIFLVTKAWHLTRAVNIFEQQGFNVIPAPTGFDGFATKRELRYYHFMPSGSALQTNYFAMHEMLGRAWYFIRYSS